MKETYERTDLEIAEFDVEDVIATSGGAPVNDHYDDYEGQGYIFD
jgi:hypothetical protein